MRAGSRLSTAFLLTLFFQFVRTSQADILIDSFDTPQNALGGPGIAANVAAGNGILGGERDFVTFLRFSANGTVPGQLHVAFPEGQLTGRAGGDIFYDGVDNDPYYSSYTGLGTLDLTQGGANDRFRFNITSITSSSASLMIEVAWPSHVSTIELNLPHTPGYFDVPFAAFQRMDPYAAVDFHQVGFINVHFNMSSGDAMTIDSITVVPEPSMPALIAGFCVAQVALRRRRVSLR